MLSSVDEDSNIFLSKVQTTIYRLLKKAKEILMLRNQATKELMKAEAHFFY